MLEYPLPLVLRYNLQVESVSVVSEKKLFNGETVTVAECLIGDETACGVLIIKNGTYSYLPCFALEQIDVVKAGATISIMNANAIIRDKYLRIDADKWARVIVHDQVCHQVWSYWLGVQAIESINKEQNISTIEYEAHQTPNESRGNGRGRGGRGRGGNRVRGPKGDEKEKKDEDE